MQFTRASIMLQCADVPAARDFYVTHLGLEVNADIGWFVGMQHPAHPDVQFELSLCEAEHELLPAAYRRPSDGVVLAFEAADVDVVAAELKAAGVPILKDPIDEPWGQRHFFAAAPDGVVLDIFQPIPPDIGWLRRHGFGA